jgi:hypothetical protein
MKALMILSALLSTSMGLELATTQKIHDPQELQMPMPMPMMMMMYMNFWDGNEMSFLFVKCTSSTSGQFILGLTVVFVGAAILEMLHHYRSALYRGSIAKMALEQTRNA